MRWLTVLLTLLIIIPTSFALEVSPKEIVVDLAPLTIESKKLTLNTNESEQIRMKFNCTLGQERCDWMNFLVGDYIYRELLFEMNNETKEVWIEIVIPQEYEKRESQIDILIKNQTVPVRFRIEHRFDFIEEWVIKVWDFWKRELIDFPNPLIPPIYGSYIIILISTLIIFLIGYWIWR